MDEYIEKVKKFNKREDYSKDIKASQILLEYCSSLIRTKKIFIVGTGLGGDIKTIKKFKKFKITGIEPRPTFQEYSSKKYKRFGGKLLKMDLGEFIKITKKISGIFLFIHSINHIPKKQIKTLQKSIKHSYVIIVNPNPQIEKIIGKTDNTVISYLSAKDIQKQLNCDIVCDFFYNLIKIKENEIFLREAILLKTKD